MGRLLKWIVGIFGALVLLALAAFVVIGSQQAGAADEREKLVAQTQALEEQLVKARVVLDNLDTYQKDYATLARAAEERGLTKPDEEVLLPLANALGARFETKAGPEGATLVVLSKPGKAPELAELARGVEEARLVLTAAVLEADGVRVEALLSRVVVGSLPDVVRKGPPAAVEEGPPPGFDLTGLARERSRLERAQKELAALEASAPGILLLVERGVSERRKTEDAVKRWDSLFAQGLASSELQRAMPVLELMESASLTASQARLTLQGKPRNGAPTSAIASPLAALFEVTKTSEDAAPLRIEMKRAVERAAK